MGVLLTASKGLRNWGGKTSWARMLLGTFLSRGGGGGGGGGIGACFAVQHDTYY